VESHIKLISKRDKDFESPTHYSYHDKEFYAHVSLWVGIQGYDFRPQQTMVITIKPETPMTL